MEGAQNPKLFLSDQGLIIVMPCKSVSRYKGSFLFFVQSVKINIRNRKTIAPPLIANEIEIKCSYHAKIKLIIFMKGSSKKMVFYRNIPQASGPPPLSVHLGIKI